MNELDNLPVVVVTFLRLFDDIDIEDPRRLKLSILSEALINPSFILRRRKVSESSRFNFFIAI